MDDSRLIVVSNRLPALENGISLKSAGGLVSALIPALEAETGETCWFGWSGRSSRRLRVETGVTGRLSTFALSLPETAVAGYYDNFCNGGLWPLLHSFPSRFAVNSDDWKDYRRVNALFATAISKRLRPTDRIWVHDFHLVPLAGELRRRGFRGPIGFFLHVPFPAPDIWELNPWADDLARDLAAYDLVGFHTREYARNYRRSMKRSERARAGVHPIGIDPEPFQTWSRELASVRRGKELRDGLLGRKLVLGVDRLDYTKGIGERLRIFARLLELHPRWRRRVSFIQISAPSRTRVAEYMKQRREVEELVGNLNGRHGDTEWVPVRYRSGRTRPRSSRRSTARPTSPSSLHCATA